jgi:hypothetical protein
VRSVFFGCKLGHETGSNKERMIREFNNPDSPFPGCSPEFQPVGFYYILIFRIKLVAAVKSLFYLCLSINTISQGSRIYLYLQFTP